MTAMRNAISVVACRAACKLLRRREVTSDRVCARGTTRHLAVNGCLRYRPAESFCCVQSRQLWTPGQARERDIADPLLT